MSPLAKLDPNAAADRPPRRRRVIPVSLRMYVALLALIGVGSALWIAVPPYRQLVAIREIERLRGKINSKAVGPKWLRNRIGYDVMRLFDDVISVQLTGTLATDGTLRSIGGLTNPTTITLGRTQVTDAGLVHLTGLNRLQSLNLANTQVTDAGLLTVKQLANLQVLGLDHTQVTDAGLMHLNSLAKLRVLRLAHTSVTDAGLQHLMNLPHLELLELSRTYVTDAGILDVKRALPKVRIERW